ncbi:MAG: extracellular solute-binding protein [Desulfobacterales bacterium]
MLILVSFLAGACQDPHPSASEDQNDTPQKIFSAPISPTPPPADLAWLTNDSDPVYAASQVERGGTLRLAIRSFPLTFRTVGPDSNAEFRGAILGNNLSLTGLHPNTMSIVPELATHWAFGADKKSMYFKLNPAARWSDGEPVTAHDFAYTLEFMRSKHIVAPWYNDYYTKEIDRVLVFDDHTLAVVGTKAEPDLHLKLPLAPTPRHYFGELGEDFVRRYNWKIVPNTGPYQITDFQKGKTVKFSRKKEWWARDLKYFHNRFNVNRVIYTVVRNENMEWEYFKKARVDLFDLNLPKYWHVRSNTPVIAEGYVQRLWFYNDISRSPFGLWLNQDREIFADRNVRYAFAHAMNMQKVIEQVLRGDFTRLAHAYVGYGPYSNTTIQARDFDIQKAAQYMQAAGWQRGADGIWVKNQRRFSVEVTYGSDQHTPKLVVLKEEAKRAGVELRLQNLDPSAWYKKISENRHEVIMMGFGTGLRPSYWQLWHSDNAHKPQTNNVTNTDDPELDPMIDAYRNSLEGDERIRLSLEIQEKIHEIGAFVPEAMRPYFRQAHWRWWRLPEPLATQHSSSAFSPFDSMTGGLFWYDGRRHEETRNAMKKDIPFEAVTRVDETYKSL